MELLKICNFNTTKILISRLQLSNCVRILKILSEKKKAIYLKLVLEKRVLNYRKILNSPILAEIFKQ